MKRTLFSSDEYDTDEAYRVFVADLEKKLTSLEKRHPSYTYSPEGVFTTIKCSTDSKNFFTCKLKITVEILRKEKRRKIRKVDSDL